MRKLFLIFCLLAVSTTTVYSQGLRSGGVSLYAIDSNGERVPLKATSSGSLESTATISGDVQLNESSLAVVQNGDTWVIRQDGSGNVHLTGSDVNVATDTELQNLQTIANTIEDRLSNSGVVQIDSQGDTVNYQLAPFNYSNVSIIPGNSQTVLFSSQASRVAFNASGASEYRYELNSATADTSSMPVFKGQYIEKSNGSYNQITFYNLSTNAENADITVELEN